MIRSATPSDAPAITAIYNPYVIETAISFEMEPVTPEDMAARIRKILQGYPWIVLEQDSAILGYAYAGQFKERSAYQASVETTVYVAAGHHKQGIGRTLYQELLQELRARGFHTALGIIALPNEGSVALHESQGFSKVAHLPEVGWKFGQWVDVGYWSLLL